MPHPVRGEFRPKAVGPLRQRLPMIFVYSTSPTHRKMFNHKPQCRERVEYSLMPIYSQVT